ncbi:MAG: hypothetical protein K9H49_00395 [Bacteroidales bacterium]|nr:hypothetical protein [Bacteroidales bacterium]MCF8389313.1 hypothetical protein [Bacteroidales bacterium]
MENYNQYIDRVIRESLNEKKADSIPPDLSEKIIKRISRDKLLRSIFFDFSIKSVTLFILITISVAVFLTLGNQTDYWLISLKENIPVLIGLFGIAYFIFFLNEITEKYLSDDEPNQNKKYNLL